MAIPDLQRYSELVYTLPDRYSIIRHSTLTLATIGRKLAKLEGQINFEGGIVLDVWELVDLDAHRILNYSYEIYRVGEKVAWYDPFEHPASAGLASTFPHHKHIPPDIKHNRTPAPGISFDAPNLPHLIEEIQREVLSAGGQ